jgi:hypothetical protein
MAEEQNNSDRKHVRKIPHRVSSFVVDVETTPGSACREPVAIHMSGCANPAASAS